VGEAVNGDKIAFDLLKSERSSNYIRMEAEKLIKVADKLAVAVADIPNWWGGDSKYSFIHSANELDSLMRKAAERICELSNNMTATAENNRTFEEHLKIELNSAGKPWY